MYPKMDGLLRKTLLKLMIGVPPCKETPCQYWFWKLPSAAVWLSCWEVEWYNLWKKRAGEPLQKRWFPWKSILCKKGDFLWKSILCKKSDFLGTATFGKKVGFLRATFAKKVISLEQHPLQKRKPCQRVEPDILPSHILSLLYCCRCWKNTRGWWKIWGNMNWWVEMQLSILKE